jgi:MFS family permease
MHPIIILSLISFAANWDFYAILPSIYFRVTTSLPEPRAPHNSTGPPPISSAAAATYGWTVACFPLAALAFSFPAGAMTDIAGARTTLLIGLMLMVMGNVLYMINHDGLALPIAGRIVAGIGSAVRTTCLAYLSRAYTGPERGAKIGQWYGIGMIGMVAGPALAASLSKVDATSLKLHAESMPAVTSALVELTGAILVAYFGIPDPGELSKANAAAAAEQHSEPQSEAPHVAEAPAAAASPGKDSRTNGRSNLDFELPTSSRHLQSPEDTVPVLGSDEPQRSGGANYKAIDDGHATQQPPSVTVPPWIWFLMLANFILTLAVTAFEAVLTPIIHQRFDGPRWVANLVFLGIGVVVIISSVVQGVLARCVKGPTIIISGTLLFVAGAVASYDYSGLPHSAMVALEVFSVLLCCGGFTVAFVKIPDEYAKTIVRVSGGALLPKIGMFMALLSMGASLARAAGPIALGYTLNAGQSVVAASIAGVLGFLLLALLVAKLWFMPEYDDETSPPDQQQDKSPRSAERLPSQRALGQSEKAPLLQG